MRKVTVNRPQKLKFPFTKGKILLDGTERETVKAGKTAMFEIPDGDHDIQLVFASIPPVESDILRIDSSDGDTSFEIKISVPLNNENSTYAELTKK